MKSKDGFSGGGVPSLSFREVKAIEV